MRRLGPGAAAFMLCSMGQAILLFGTGYEIPSVPKCKTACPRQLSLAVSTPLSFALSASLLRDASEGAKMRNHLVRKRPLSHAEMTRLAFIMIAGGWSLALVAIFNRPTGIG